MSQNRNIAYDATFMILYIGFSAAMVAVSVALLSLLAIGSTFGLLEVAASVLNLAGWFGLPFAPHLYRSLVGHRFSWRENAVFDGEIV
jgi:hypothetical protein